MQLGGNHPGDVQRFADEPGWDPRGKVYSIVAADQGWQRIAGKYGQLLRR